MTMFCRMQLCAPELGKRISLLASAMLILLILLILQACNPQNSAGSSLNAVAASTPIELLLEKKGQNDLGSYAEQVVSAAGSSFKLKAKWSFEPIKAGTAKLLFISDVSGSMKHTDPECKRYTAMQSLVQSLAASSPEANSLEFGLVTFSDTANIVSRRTEGTPSFLNHSVMSSPDAKTAICDQAGATNYAAAFREATTLLQTLVATPDMQLVAIFVTDGMPTQGMDGTAEVGAFKDLLKRYGESSTIKAIYLDSNTGMPVPIGASSIGASSIGPSSVYDPKTLLGSITGSADNVRTVNDAAQLAQGLSDLVTKSPDPLDVTSVKIESVKDGQRTLLCAGNDPKSQNPAMCVVDTSASGVWTISPSNNFAPGATGQVEVSGKRLGNTPQPIRGVFPFKVQIPQ